MNTRITTKEITKKCAEQEMRGEQRWYNQKKISQTKQETLLEKFKNNKHMKQMAK